DRGDLLRRLPRRRRRRLLRLDFLSERRSVAVVQPGVDFHVFAFFALLAILVQIFEFTIPVLWGRARCAENVVLSAVVHVVVVQRSVAAAKACAQQHVQLLQLIPLLARHMRFGRPRCPALALVIGEREPLWPVTHLLTLIKKPSRKYARKYKIKPARDISSNAVRAGS
ncbi:hypothetical protein DL89DRAFT_5067, partial [Linderina pennispora]